MMSGILLVTGSLSAGLSRLFLVERRRTSTTNLEGINVLNDQMTEVASYRATVVDEARAERWTSVAFAQQLVGRIVTNGAKV